MTSLSDFQETLVARGCGCQRGDFPFFGFAINDYYLRIVLLIAINIILGVSLNLINGYTGQFSLGHAGFMAIGAYALRVFIQGESRRVVAHLFGNNEFALTMLFAHRAYSRVGWRLRWPGLS